MQKIFLITLILASLSIGCIEHVEAQTLKLGFYNVENVFDTINSPGTADGEYTPIGSKQWTHQRYTNKIKSLGNVLRAMDCDIVGICEVENQKVVEDIANENGYDYLHIDTHDARGMDQALLFRTKRFEINKFSLVGNNNRGFLLIEGISDSVRLDILVVHLPSKMSRRKVAQNVMLELKNIIDSLTLNNDSHVILMGDFNCNPDEKLIRQNIPFDGSPIISDSTNQMFNPFLSLSRQGKGSIVWHNRLKMFDQIIISKKLLNHFNYKAEVFAPNGLFEQHGQRKGYPHRTYIGNKYLGGTSDHLPVKLTLYGTNIP